MQLIIESIIILILVIFQSIFGVGLLLFGTPIFLLIGYNFISTLTLLLPISIITSFLQIINQKKSFKPLINEFNFFCLPFLNLVSDDHFKYWGHSRNKKVSFNIFNNLIYYYFVQR